MKRKIRKLSKFALSVINDMSKLLKNKGYEKYDNTALLSDIKWLVSLVKRLINEKKRDK